MQDEVLLEIEKALQTGSPLVVATVAASRGSTPRKPGAKMVVREDLRYTRDYLEPDKRAIANSVQIFFRDGSMTQKAEVEYPVGHRRRRAEGLPLLVEKFQTNATSCFSAERIEQTLALFEDVKGLDQTQVDEFVGKLVP